MHGDKSGNYTDTPFLRNGIDRIDNNKGYTKENCVPCCDICNRIKMDLPYNVFIEHITKCYKNLTK